MQELISQIVLNRLRKIEINLYDNYSVNLGSVSEFVYAIKNSLIIGNYSHALRMIVILDRFIKKK